MEWRVLFAITALFSSHQQRRISNLHNEDRLFARIIPLLFLNGQQEWKSGPSLRKQNHHLNIDRCPFVTHPLLLVGAKKCNRFYNCLGPETPSPRRPFVFCRSMSLFCCYYWLLTGVLFARSLLWDYPGPVVFHVNQLSGKMLFGIDRDTDILTIPGGEALIFYSHALGSYTQNMM